MKKLEELGASPAPWEQDEESALPEVICHLQSGIRYQVAVPYIHSDEETDANTRLICAGSLRCRLQDGSGVGKVVHP